MGTMKTNVLLSAQVAVLGCILIQPELCGEIFSRITAQDFPTAEYRHVFEAAHQLFARGEVVDSVTVLVELGGGAERRRMLMDMIDLTPSAAAWDTYCDKLRERSQHYHLTNICGRIAKTATRDEALAMLEEARRIAVAKPKVRIVPIAQGYQDFSMRQSGEAPEYLQFGIGNLDKFLFVEAGDFVVIGGRPSAGKTALGIAMADTLSRKNRVGFFSLETSAEKIYDRYFAQSCLLNFRDIKKRTLSAQDFERMINNKKHFLACKLDVIDAAGFTVDEIRRIALQEQYDVIFIDYLQLIRAQKTTNRTEEVSRISMELHQMAQEHHITIIALCQLSRPEKEKKENGQRSPKMEDIRESGQIEQDADAIMMLYLLEPDNPTSARRLKIAKNKEGPRAHIDLDFDGKTQTFAEIVEDRPEANYFKSRRPPTATPVLCRDPEPSVRGGSPEQLALQPQN